jgi:uncharacterized protein YndB with AHSA1/START domain
MNRQSPPGLFSLEVRRVVAADAETVFNAWTNPDALRHWIGPTPEFTRGEVSVDLRVGGRYRFNMISPDGKDNIVGGKYVEIAPPNSLSFTWQWEGEHEFSEAETLVSLQFLPHADGTEVVLTHEKFPVEEMKDKHMQGWTGCLEQLANRIQ